MNSWQALVIGIVEGLTEYLPVSSTGHIILTQRALGIPDDGAARAFAICVQAGAIVAVLGIFARRVRQMILGLLGRDPAGRDLALKLILAFLPAAIVGVLLEKRIEQYLFGLWPIVGAWFVGGLAILVVARWMRTRPTDASRPLEGLTWQGALAIGLMQCLGMWPGTSRSLVTILGGLFVGLELAAALEFSFLLGLITLTAATGYKAMKDGRLMIETYSPTSLTIGFLAAAVAAGLAVAWMLQHLRRRGLALFGYYRILLAVVVAVLLLTHRLSP